MSEKPVTIAIVEDSPGLRRNMETIIQRAEGFECVGSFEDGEQALDAIPALRPRVVLMDINLPGIDGVQCVARLARDLPDTQMIMITVYDDTDAIFDSLAAGAGGYLLKPVRSAQLIAAIREIIAGGAPMSSNIARRVVQTFRKPAAAPEGMSQLSARENEVLEHLAKGLLQKEIADQLGISYWTVQTHIARIYEKLHVHSRAQAVAKYHGQ
jgi:DNA-binding NarL/FixJ family response regulator